MTVIPLRATTIGFAVATPRLNGGRRRRIPVECRNLFAKQGISHDRDLHGDILALTLRQADHR
jgi:hypothetical protein